MSDGARGLAALLQPERLDADLFRAPPMAPGQGPSRLYGGQVIAQCLAAAGATLPGDRLCHSAHSYFLRAGRPDQPLIFQVERARDGGSFSTRRVLALQDGRGILSLTASFHGDDDGWDHQHPMPDVPAPEALTPEAHGDAGAERSVEAMNKAFHRAQFEIREVTPMDDQDPQPADDRNGFWFRMPPAQGGDPDDSAARQQRYLAYASDIGLMGVGLRPHGMSWAQNRVQGASLDHSIWFHAPTRLQDWHFYAMDGPWTGRGRSFARGMIFDRDGALVASTAQESLMRPRKA
ncbi:MAG: acyl-CoA thioesterase II [Marinibacterium sp.]|nr:acyl-CoA thioesterase II [Marinibacterium sp.]